MRTHTNGRKAALAILATLALTGVAACSSDSDGRRRHRHGDGRVPMHRRTRRQRRMRRPTRPRGREAPDGTDAPADTAEETDTTEASTDGGLGEPNPATGDPIKIGFVTDGEAAAIGSDEDRVQTVEATVEYANEYLGGINGHPIELEHCSTEATPAGGTQCAVELASAGVAAALVPASSQDGAIFEGLAGSGIPYVTYVSATGAIITSPDAFVMSNSISSIATPALTAQAQGIDKVAFVIIDVPAAVGPITALATPIYASLGVDLEIIPIAPSVADMTPQLQQAIGGGAGLFAVTGTDDFLINGINGLRQLGFEGPITTGSPTEEVLAALTTTENLLGSGSQTDAPDDPDVALMHTILETYSDLAPEDADPNGFASVIGLVEALTGATDAVDAATISAALKAMPETDLPLGAGITFQCGTAPVNFAPAICSIDVLQWTYDEDGEQQDIAVVDVPSDVLKLG